MEVFSVWPFFACMAVLWTLAATPLFRSADAPPSDKGFRVTTIDGLRGFLALSVVFHHGAVYDGFLREDLWAVPPSRFYAMIGQVGVAIFFMITGYLFWGRMVETQGRPGWVKFYIGRLFRIGPLYLLAIAVMLSIVFAHTGPHLNVPPMTLAVQVGRWLLLGLFESWNVNGYPHAGHALAGVTWTLRYEWLFYASLLLTAFAARSDRTHLPFALVGLALTLTITAMHPSADPSCAALFFAGMTCASLEQVGLRAKVPDWMASAMILTLIALTLVLFPTVLAAAPIVLLAIAFYFIVMGSSVFGALTNRAALRLGNVSYGIYLLQGLALTTIFSIGLPPGGAPSSPAHHWMLVLLSAVFLIIVAAATHVLIERPGIKCGKWIGARFAPFGTGRTRQPMPG